MDLEIANYLSERLKQIPDEELVLNTQQIISVIGKDATEEIAISTVTLTTDMRPRRKKRSAIPLHKRFKHEGCSRFNRLELIGAIEKARIDYFECRNGRGTSTSGN